MNMEKHIRCYIDRKYMEKIGNGWNDYNKLYIQDGGAANGINHLTRDKYAMNASEAKQYKAWKNQMTQDNTADLAATKTYTVIYRTIWSI